MALVDTLEYFPPKHSRRAELIAILNRLARAVTKYQDQGSRTLVSGDENGRLNLEGTVIVGGLGGNPYRDGSYEYYLSERVITNDPKGVAALLLAATEMETISKKNRGRGSAKRGKLSVTK